jgi:hypothetical protein
VIDIEKMKALAAELRKGSCGRYKWYAMGRDETSYFMDFDWGYDADRWFNDQQKSNAAWIEKEGIHIVKKLFQTELETDAAEAADAIDTLLSELEAAKRERDELRAARIAYASEFEPDAEGLPDTGNIHANIRKLKAELEAREADRRDAERYRKWVSYSGFTKEHADSTLDAIPINEYAALAQRQEGEDDERA